MKKTFNTIAGGSRIRNSIESGTFLGRIGKGRGPIQKLRLADITQALKQAGFSGGGISISAADPTATASDTAVNGTATTYMRSDAAPAVQKASSSQFGIVKVDGSTITASGGVISAVAATGGGALTTTMSYGAGSSGSNAGVAAIGHRFALQNRDITLYTASTLFTTVTGGTYKMGIAPWDDVNKKITAAPTYADATYTETAGGLKSVSFSWAAGVNLTLASPGPMYLLFIVRTDSTSTVGITANFTTSNQVGEGVYLSEASAAAHLASLAPATTDTWTMNSATFVMPMTYKLN
jgi:hypothetical protein